MAKVKDLTITARDAAGTTFEFSVAVNVSKDGIFSATIPSEPSELSEIAGSLKHDDKVEVSRHAVGTRVSSKVMDSLGRFLKDVAEAYHRCEVTIEDVILYECRYNACFYRAADGSLRPNAVGCSDDGGEWGGNLNNSSTPVTHYGVEFYARVMRKTTYTRPSGSKSVYSKLELPNGSYGERLNAFLGVVRPFESAFRIDREERRFSEVPYTEQAAEFFYVTFVGICHLADRMSKFFAKPEHVQLAIDKRMKVLCLPEATQA